MRFLILIASLLVPVVAIADTVVPTRTIRAKEIIAANDLETKPQKVAGGVSDTEVLVGLEARVALYPGRPIRATDVGPPALVDRNDLVVLIFDRQPLSITAEGRALGRGAAGDRIRVMNLSSRTTISGVVRPDGNIEVK
ncbi:flagellar basal body P-ring formation chaperone FlgA [Ruegeria profundi]|uniref:flagellar basal body P-ring formation chaperone FlgA n=1 Tax=Ruegeria profundi TaxID=1685378 RepID=UPI001CD4E7A5|nr:flagellar basal body P-ring formation chaperone FlgA [Ruegeria profundi]MCA0930514.1 flagellar basal body P-ring formation protein FlgA [Ruegeria profundi]